MGPHPYTAALAIAYALAFADAYPELVGTLNCPEKGKISLLLNYNSDVQCLARQMLYAGGLLTDAQLEALDSVRRLADVRGGTLGAGEDRWKWSASPAASWVSWGTLRRTAPDLDRRLLLRMVVDVHTAGTAGGTDA